MRILVTGAAGFVGPWLVRELAAHGHVVIASAMDPVELREAEGGLCIAADLTDSAEVFALVNQARAEAVIHLAGWSHVGESWAQPGAAIRSNIEATATLFDTWAATGTARRFLFVSTSEVYGVVKPEALPLNERSPIAPVTPYAATKLAAEQMLRVLSARRAAAVTIARPFSHTGPGQSPRFICPGFAEQVAQVEEGVLDRIRHGDLSPRRDFLDVRDVVRAYRLIVEGDYGAQTFNIASGIAVPMQQVLDTLCELGGVDPSIAELDHARLRPVEVPVLQGDSTLLKEATGWVPGYSLRETLADILAEARSHQAQWRSRQHS